MEYLAADAAEVQAATNSVDAISKLVSVARQDKYAKLLAEQAIELVRLAGERKWHAWNANCMSVLPTKCSPLSEVGMLMRIVRLCTFAGMRLYTLA